MQPWGALLPTLQERHPPASPTNLHTLPASPTHTPPAHPPTTHHPSTVTHPGPSPAQSPPPREGSQKATAATRGAPHSRWGPPRRRSRHLHGWSASGRCPKAHVPRRRRSHPRPPPAGWVLAASMPPAACWAPHCGWVGRGGGRGESWQQRPGAWDDGCTVGWAWKWACLSGRPPAPAAWLGLGSSSQPGATDQQVPRTPVTWCRRRPCARSSWRAAAGSGRCLPTCQTPLGCRCCGPSRLAARMRRGRDAPAAASAHRQPPGCMHTAAPAADGVAGHRRLQLCGAGASCAGQGRSGPLPGAVRLLGW